MTTEVHILRPGINACPFCKHPGMKGCAIYLDRNGRSKKAYYVICENDECNVSMPGKDFEDARTKWNVAAPQGQPKEE